MLVNDSCPLTRACTSDHPTLSSNAAPLLPPIPQKQWIEWSTRFIVGSASQLSKSGVEGRLEMEFTCNDLAS